MEDERLGTNYGSPESPCSKDNNNINNNNTRKEQDRFLPIANVGRIMKKVIPGNGKISKDAKETVQECVSEFISFVTGEASDKCQREKRKTINGDDIIREITVLGFEDYVKPLKLYLSKYREVEGEKLNSPKQQQTSEQLLIQLQHPLRQQQQQHHSIILHQDDQQFQQVEVDQRLSPFVTSLYSSFPNTSIPSKPLPFVTTDQSLSLPFSPTSVHKSYQYQE